MKIDSKRSFVLLLSGVLLAALGLRLFHLQQRVLWFDEANSLLIARASPGRIINAVLDDTHSPFYYLVLHYWQHVAGGELGARLLSVFAGVATVAVVYSLGCVLAGRGAGLLSAALLSVCPLHVWYSQEIRMYALQTALVSLSFLFMALALRRGRGAFWAGYAICTALSLYAQYVSVFVVIGQNIFVAIYYWRDRRKLRHWLLAQCAVATRFCDADKYRRGKFVVSAAGAPSNPGLPVAVQWRLSGRFKAAFPVGSDHDRSSHCCRAGTLAPSRKSSGGIVAVALVHCTHRAVGAAVIESKSLSATRAGVHDAGAGVAVGVRGSPACQGRRARRGGLRGRRSPRRKSVRAKELLLLQ